jgi:2'-5' RNA ligase
VSETARLFVAADVPEAIRGAFARMRADLARRVPAARWVRPEGMHLTFHFLGESPRSRLEELADAVAGAASGASPFHLITGGLGHFGSLRRPRALWLSLEGEVDACVALTESVGAALAARGYPAERRPFRPHLTLARFMGEVDSPFPEPVRPELEEALRGISLPVEALVLFESHLASGGTRYEVRRRCPLGIGAGAPEGKGREA